MKNLLFILVLLFFYQTSNAQNFEVEIWQNNKKVKNKKDVISLKKEAFQIKIKLENLGGVYVIPSYTGDLSATVQKHFDFFEGFDLAGYNFNPHKHLRVQEDVIHYLFFISMKTGIASICME